MNEQIRQLAEQAKKSVPHGLGVDKWIETYNEIFAKLIVQECANVADRESSQPCATYGQLIKQHFGVEE